MRHPGPGTRCPLIHPGTGGVAGGVSTVDAALDALLSPVGHLTMHHQHPFTRPPPAGSSRGRTVRRVPRGSLRNGVELPCGVDEHGAEDALPGAAEGWRVAVPPASEPESQEHAAARGVLREPRVRIGVGLGRAARPPPTPGGRPIAFPKSPAHATPCAPRGAKPCQAHHLVATLTSDSNRLPSGAPSRNPAVCRVP